MSDNALDKFRKERGIDPTQTRGLEVSDLYDPEAVDAAEAEAAALPEDTGPAEQNLVEFYNPFAGMGEFDATDPGSYYGIGLEKPGLIPGVRFPKLGTIATQDFSNFLTIPANIADERTKLGGPLFSISGDYEASDAEILKTVTKYGLRGDERTIGKLIDATSPEDLAAQATVYARREQREEQIATDNPGILGLGTRILTNVLDPSFLVGGALAEAALVSRVANSATKTGAAIRFTSDGLTKAERFRIGAGVALAVDTPMEIANTVVDPSRDILMTAGFIALSPLVGGVLSSLGRNKSDDLVDAANAFDEAVAKGISGSDGGAGGSAQSGSVPFTFPEEDLPGAPARAGRFTVGTPLNFLARSADSLTRTLADKLSWNPNTRSVQGVTAAEAQRRVYQAQSIRIRAGRMAAKTYFQSRGFSPSTEQLDEFFRIVGQHISGVRISEDPAVLRAVGEYREGFADMLAYVRDKDYVSGRTRPPADNPAPAAPGAPGTPPAASSAAPNAPTPQAPQAPLAPLVDDIVEPEAVPAAAIVPETPAEAANPYFGRKSFRDGSTPAAEGPPATAADAGPAPDAFGEPQVALFDPDAPPPPAPAPETKAQSYFGRKSFRQAPAEAAPEVTPKAPDEAPVAADVPPSAAPAAPATIKSFPKKPKDGGRYKVTMSDGSVAEVYHDRTAPIAGWYVDDNPFNNPVQSQPGHVIPYLGNNRADVEANLAERLAKLQALPPAKPKAAPGAPTIKNIPEKIAQVARATDKVIEAAPSGLPGRNDLRVALKGYTEIAEQIASASDVADTGILEAAAVARQVLKGAAMGTANGFQDRYVNAINKLVSALEDAPEGSPAGKLLATLVDDLDSGYASKLLPDVEARAQTKRDQSLDERPVERRPNVADEAIAEKENLEIANIYDAFLAKAEYTGKGAKPKVTTGAVAGAAVVAATGGVGAWLIDADDDVIAGAALMSAALGAVAGTLATKGRVRHWENNSPGYALFVAPNSPGADKVSFRKAFELEAKGVDRNTIWKQTGWGRIGEQWVTEIDEPLGNLLVDLFDDEIPLGEALKATRILAVEPGLRTLVIQARGLLRDVEDDGMLGAALVKAKEVAVNVGKVAKPQQLAILLHEVNHVLQGMRGKGTNISASAEDMGDRQMAAMAEATKARERFYAAKDAGDKEAMLIAKAELDDINVATEQFYHYRTQVIEAESRLVERRLGMSRNERRAKPPWEDFDVPEDDLWSGTGASQAASLGSDLKLFRNDDWWEDNIQLGEFSGVGDIDGYAYAKMGDGDKAVYSWVEDLGEGEAVVNWDWARNIDGVKDDTGNPMLFEDNPDASPAEVARALSFALSSTERVAKSGKFDVITYEGLKKAPEGKAASGHERVYKFLAARSDTPGYTSSIGTWTIKAANGTSLNRSSFALSKDGMDVADVWAGIRRGKVDIEVIPKKARDEQLAARQERPGDPAEPTPAEPEDTYRGLEEWRNVEEDPAYLPRRYNKAGWDRVFLSPQFRGNLNKIGNRIGDVIYRSNQARMDEIGAAQGISGLDVAWKVGRKYADTVNKLMNPARGAVNPYRKITPDDREAAKEIVRDVLNDGETFGVDQEEAMEMLLDLIAPVKKKSAESARARPRIEMNLDAEQDADIIDIFEWNVESLFTAYSRNLSGYAGLLKSGFRSEAEVRGQIEQIRAQADRDPKRQRRAQREAEMLELTMDAIIGRPPQDLLANKHWSWFANQTRRMNFGNLMNNTGFLAISEVGAALTRVNVFRMIGMFPEFQRYYKQARAGDPAVRENIFYLADALMGHGSAQVRSRLSQMADHTDGSNPSIEDRSQGVFDKIDRFTRKQANFVSRVSGMSPMQEFLRMTVVTAEAQDWTRAARNGRPLYSPRRMAALGVDAPMWQRISAELRKWGDTQSPDSGNQVPNMALDGWEDAEALNVFLNALDRNANRLVMEGDVGHQAFWLRNRPSAQLLFQFLNFPMNAFSKHAGFALNVADARAGQEMFAMSLGGAVGYTARVLAQGGTQDTEEERTAYYADRLTGEEFGKAMFYYGGHYSLAPNVIDFAGFLGKTAGIPGVAPVFSKTRASGLPGDVFTGNPTYSRFINPKGALSKLTDPFKGTKFSEQDVQGLVKHFAPLGNHIALNAFLDQALEFLPDEEGSVEDQVQN